MKLEYLKDISNGGLFKDVVSDKLVRLYDFNSQDVKTLRDVIQARIIDQKQDLDISSLIDFIQKINCNLIFRVSDKNIGVSTKDFSTFYCDLSINGYEKMIKLISPFCDSEQNGFQWLYDIDTDIDLLFSVDGQW